VGKSPARLLKPAKIAKSELLELKRKLEKAIHDEAFEEAARLRDQVRRIEHQEQQAKQKSKESKS